MSFTNLSNDLEKIFVSGTQSGDWNVAYKPNSFGTRIIMSSSVLGISIPTFWLGLMMIIVFSVFLGWLPVSGRGEIGSFLGIQSSLFTFDGLMHLIMPATNLALFKIAMVIRLARAGTEEVMSCIKPKKVNKLL